MMKIIDSFPTPVVINHIEEELDDLFPSNIDSIIKAISNNQEGQYASEDLRVLDKHPRIKNIFLNKFKEIPLNYDNDFRITTSWYTKLEKNLYSHFHNHKNSFWSGVYYPQDSTGDIEFKSPLQTLTSFLIVPSEYNQYNTGGMFVRPEKNMIVFFPSYLEHRIRCHKDEKPRYSLAFNIVPIGSYGMGDSLLI